VEPHLSSAPSPTVDTSVDRDTLVSEKAAPTRHACLGRTARAVHSGGSGAVRR